MTQPKLGLGNQQVNIDEVLRREKLRIISEETSRTQERLRMLETSRAAERATRIPRMPVMLPTGLSTNPGSRVTTNTPAVETASENQENETALQKDTKAQESSKDKKIANE